MSDAYYDDYVYEDELDVRLRRGRASPVHQVVYPEGHHCGGLVPRPAYYGGAYLVPEPGGVGHRRSRSHSGPVRTQASPPPAPVIINKIYNDHDDEDDSHRQLVLPHRSHSRSRSRSRHGRPSSPRPSSAYYGREDWDRDDRLERTERELERLRMREEREKIKEKQKLMEKDLEIQRLKAEKKADEEKAKLKKEKELAIEIYKMRDAKAKSEKEDREKEYQKRLVEDMRKMGLDEGRIAQLSRPGSGIDVNRPTYTRMARKHLSIESLRSYGIHEYDVNPEHILIKRLVPEWEQDQLWQHTKHIRESRRLVSPVYIEGRPKHKHHSHHEPELEFVRERKHDRKPSPSPLLAWVAGGKR